MSGHKRFSGFPNAPVVTDVNRRAHLWMFWRQLAALLLVAALWFVTGITLSLSLVHPTYAPLASGILVASMVFSVALALWGLREDVRPVFAPLHTQDSLRGCVKSAAPDDIGTDDDVISLLPAALFKRSKQLPTGE